MDDQILDMRSSKLTGSIFESQVSLKRIWRKRNIDLKERWEIQEVATPPRLKT